MKNLTIVLFLLFGAFSAQAQITIAPYEIELAANIDAVDDIPAVTASSTCGDVTTEVKDMVFSGGCLGNLVRTYTFSDDCGNVERAQQFIKLQDNTPPVIEVGVLANTDDGLAFPEVSANDNSGKKVELTFTEKSINGQTARVYTATDVCGNTATKEVSERVSDQP